MNAQEYMKELEALPIEDQVRKVKKDMRNNPEEMLQCEEIHMWILENKDIINRLSESGALDLD